MSPRPRLVLAIAAALAAIPAVAAAQTGDAQRAEALNDEGKELFKEARYLEAYERFRAAAETRADGRYYFNVCFTLNYLERYEEAIEACEAVEPSGADAELLEKTATVLEALREKVPADTGDTGDTAGTGGDTGGDTGAGGPSTPPPAGPPAPDPFAVKKAKPGQYAWALGAELGVLSSSLGRGDDLEHYGSGGVQLHAFGNFMLSEDRGFGGQGYLNLSDIASGAVNSRLRVVDVGAALFWQFPLTSSVTWTPLVGAHVSAQKPRDDIADALLALGLRGEVSFAYVISDEHAITLTPALNLYTPGTSSAIEASDYGLDTGGATFTVAVGYQYRFSTPFGTTPIFTLE